MRDFEALTYQTVGMFIICTHVQFTTSPRITYDRVLGAGLYSLSSTYVYSVHLFLFYQGRQSFRAFGQPYSLTSFGRASTFLSDLTMCMYAKRGLSCYITFDLYKYS